MSLLWPLINLMPLCKIKVLIIYYILYIYIYIHIQHTTITFNIKINIIYLRSKTLKIISIRFRITAFFHSFCAHTHRVSQEETLPFQADFSCGPSGLIAKSLLRASNNQSGGWNGGMISADLREEEAESGFAPSPCCPPWGKETQGGCAETCISCAAWQAARCMSAKLGQHHPSLALCLSLTHTLQSISCGFGNICIIFACCFVMSILFI